MADYTLYYWPIPFRGHFIRYLLAGAGASWDEAGFDAVSALKQLPPADQPYPFMAPPLLHDHGNDQWLSQLPAIMIYLARRHGVGGDPDLGLRLVCDASDILFEITCHHGATMWDRAAWQGFASDRLPRWMQLHQVLLARGGFDAAAPGLPDLVLAALWHTMVDRLPALRPVLADHAPGVETLVDQVAARPAIRAMLDGWRDSPMRYCGGQIEASILDMLKPGEMT